LSRHLRRNLRRQCYRDKKAFLFMCSDYGPGIILRRDGYVRRNVTGCRPMWGICTKNLQQKRVNLSVDPFFTARQSGFFW
ncbi:hypothetical protein, partial [Pseudomonas avellanae]|uniref:hypothetical protein n=2 Tax=Pseudomonas avellanae TaxID=46257 RepID=UPI0019D39E03